MKLMVQIPCFNEEKTLPLVLEKIPKKIEGISEIEVLVIDDGSTDKTVEVAKQYGVDHIIRNKSNKGLAYSFRRGLHYCLQEKADIIINTDGDNQYPQEKIPDLINPIINGTHEIVISDRQTQEIDHFGPIKKILQKFGTYIVNKAAGTNIPDAASGFRAYSRIAAMKLNVITDFSYCMETIIYAGRKNISIAHVPIKTNPKTRKSRLFNNMWQHVYKSASAILRSYAMYQAFKIFIFSGLFLVVIGTIPFFRFIYLMFLAGETLSGHLQSLLVGSVFVIVGFLIFTVGILADLISINRKFIEELLERARRNDYS